MDLEELTYVYVVLASAIGGLARFLDSSKSWKVRTVVATMLLGSIGGLLFVSVVFDYMLGGKVVQYRWLCIAIAAAIGVAQPRLALVVQAFAKAAGVNVTLENP